MTCENSRMPMLYYYFQNYLIKSIPMQNSDSRINKSIPMQNSDPRIKCQDTILNNLQLNKNHDEQFPP